MKTRLPGFGLLGLLMVIPACSSPGGSVRLDLDRQEVIEFRGHEYTTTLRGIAIAESDLVPAGTAILTHTGVIDASVWALPGVDPAKLIVVRTPPGFDEPGWVVGEFIYFQRKGVAGTVQEACAFFADPTPGCPSMDRSPGPS